MRVLFVGDIVGRAGRQAAFGLIPALRNAHDVDCVIANGENAAGGIGITPPIAQELLDRAAIDVLTLGNHAWAKREIYPYLQNEARILRPANYPLGAPGQGMGVFETHAGLIGVLSLQGRVFMDIVDDPFRAADAGLETLSRGASVLIVDVHAEATSEKLALAWHVAGRASAVIGTHTHVQTADERVLQGGTAFISDVGMTGPTESIIGMKRDVVMQRFLTGLPARFDVAEGPAVLSAVLLDVDEATGRALSIVRIQEAFG